MSENTDTDLDRPRPISPTGELAGADALPLRPPRRRRAAPSSAPVPPAPLREQELDAQGRAYATGRRKDAVARVWLKPGTRQDHRQRPRPGSLLRASDAAPGDQPAVRDRRARRPVRRRLPPSRAAGFRARPARSSTASAQALQQVRAGAAQRGQGRRLPDPRQPRGRAQEVRPRQGPQELPVLEALSRLRYCHRPEGGQPRWPPFSCPAPIRRRTLEHCDALSPAGHAPRAAPPAASAGCAAQSARCSAVAAAAWPPARRSAAAHRGRGCWPRSAPPRYWSSPCRQARWPSPGRSSAADLLSALVGLVAWHFVPLPSIAAAARDGRGDRRDEPVPLPASARRRLRACSPHLVAPR